MTANPWEKLFADADARVREPRRPFDVGAGLRRLAHDIGYVPPTPAAPASPNARRRLGAMARCAVTQAGAAAHVEKLTALLGPDENEDSVTEFDGWTNGVDIDGVQVFACTLYLARHPESARFWWRFAAGAGHNGAAYCLYLDHLGLGEEREARFWKKQVTTTLFSSGPSHDPDPEEFLKALDSLTGYFVRNPTCRAITTGHLEADVERVVDRYTDGLVCRPDARIADHIHTLVGRP
ncbi:hypothetical protein OG402_41645 [Streptomyces anulatus]|uniref:hypothetical protein n=1 Tax=Streptomyces anulatus TaxID=1892 RepID=UPI0022574A06|nr:hypothetical protein [Streptomyces anulatus]MCX4523615.1 hypothetical protein [Streptomyces anulatus]MCX4523744.1 hypothetical protein [Streptomyces anulatus]MCX4606746.1 hypothetical protein [Streptomyces anulatus]MCX4606933.1 hypothetical protein [Streptomyces anulatus]WTD15380.1 hypothetical protein OHA54_39635 [Streptomyces anulatus]